MGKRLKLWCTKLVCLVYNINLNLYQADYFLRSLTTILHFSNIIMCYTSRPTFSYISQVTRALRLSHPIRFYLIILNIIKLMITLDTHHFISP
jgi:hypothetical protein